MKKVYYFLLIFLISESNSQELFISIGKTVPNFSHKWNSEYSYSIGIGKNLSENILLRLNFTKHIFKFNSESDDPQIIGNFIQHGPSEVFDFNFACKLYKDMNHTFYPYVIVRLGYIIYDINDVTLFIDYDGLKTTKIKGIVYNGISYSLGIGFDLNISKYLGLLFEVDLNNSINLSSEKNYNFLFFRIGTKINFLDIFNF